MGLGLGAGGEVSMAQCRTVRERLLFGPEADPVVLDPPRRARLRGARSGQRRQEPKDSKKHLD